MKKILTTLVLTLWISLNATEIIPRHQLTFFPIDRALLQAMSTTISNNRPYLIMARIKNDAKDIQNMQKFLNKNHINFKLVEYPQANGSVYCEIDTKTKIGAIKILSILERYSNVRVYAGKNLLPYAGENETYVKYDKNTIFSDVVQEKYMIAILMAEASSAKAFIHAREASIEAYMNDFFKRFTISPFMKMTQTQEGKDIYLPQYVGDYGVVFNADYEDIDKHLRYQNHSFYTIVKQSYQQITQKSIKNIKPIFEKKYINTDNGWLDYFNKAYLSNSYSVTELKTTVNSKGVHIYCVDSDVKMCKTQAELKEQLEQQNMFFNLK